MARRPLERLRIRSRHQAPLLETHIAGRRDRLGPMRNRARTARIVAILLAVLLTSLTTARSSDAAPPPALAMVANDATSSVTVFDMNTDTVLGSVSLGSSFAFDCSLDGQTSLGYVSDFSGHIWAIDAGAGPPVLASGTNPIVSTINTEDTSMTPDRKFLLSCDGFSVEPISVIDVATRTEVSTFLLPSQCTGVEVCADGSVLTVEYDSNIIRRLTIDGVGNLTDTGESLSLGAAFNVICGKGAQTGVAVSESGASIESFTIPGLAPIDSRSLASTGVAAVLNGAGDRLYVRSSVAVEVFSFNSATGAIGATPSLTIPVVSTAHYFGVDQLALNSAGTKLYVSEGNAVNIYDTTSGMLLGSITDPLIAEPTGICTVPSVCGNGMLEGGEACDDGNLVDGDGCDSNCTVTACGNGIVTAGEACDDGNLNNGDCCSNSCTPAPDTTPCDDNLFCNGADSCVSGACTAHAGDPCVGGAECNNVCNELNNNCFASNGSPCTDDGEVCTDDQCDGLGMCTHPGNFFVPCDDGMFCNGSDVCFGGTCSLHDGDPCMFNTCNTTCDEMNTMCDPSPMGAPCPDDGEACTNDQCNGAGACGHPPIANGTPCTDDGNDCTDDECNGAGACGHPARMDGTSCDDADACTQTDQCQDGMCVGSNPIVCSAPLCREAGTCDPTSGTCSSCPAGYSPGGGGCQKTYAIDATLLDNQPFFCSGPADRYNGCSGAFGFHWTDTADASVGAVTGVDIQIETGIDCSGGTHNVALNAAAMVVSYPSSNECFCHSSPTPQSLPDLASASYVKGGSNVISISSISCDGLTADADGSFALVTVTYGDPGYALQVESSCRQSGKSKFRYKNSASNEKDKLKWKWGKGDATSQDDYGDPTTAADYQLCVFGETSGEPTLLFGAAVPFSASLWSAVGTSGYRYQDKAASADGIKGILLRSGGDGKSKLLVKGQGTGLSDPTLPIGPGTTDVRVQLTNKSNGKCWESAFPIDHVTSDEGNIRAAAP